MTSILFRGGTVYDGLGNPGELRDLLVVDGYIRQISPHIETDAALVLDITGLALSPGFIDIHTHSDLTLLSNPLAQSKIRQGITTEVIGNCGIGPAPIPPKADSVALRAAVAYLDLDPSIEWNWASFSDFLEVLRRKEISVNIAALVGHIPIHSAVVGYGKADATSGQIIEMQELLRESMGAGAFGLSTGLAYSPISYASPAELIGLATVVAEFDGIFAWHMRNYGDDLMGSISEVLEVAKRTGVRTQVSHLVAVGERNWGAVKRVMREIDQANASGLEISMDVYPYTAGNCPLSQFLPDWAQEGGDRAMRDRLEDLEVRKRIINEWDDPLISWDDVTISAVPKGREAIVGKTISQISSMNGDNGNNVALQLLSEMGNSVGIIAGGRTNSDVIAVYNHPAVLVGSDGQALDPSGATGTGSPHPRSYGCYPRLLSKYVGNNGLSLERAIHIATGAVAQKLHISDRGVLIKSMKADLVVFNPNTVRDQATFDSPHQFPTGITHVVVNGVLTVKDEEHTGARKGQVLKQ
jgi:N-acyl-D-aspartate/D-glutamate deacylase